MSAKHFCLHVLGFFCSFVVGFLLLGVFYFKTSKALDILSTLILDFLVKDVFDY